MKITILSEHGYTEALFGLGMSHGVTAVVDELGDDVEMWRPRMGEVSKKLAGKGLGHDKFLETIQVILDIAAPRYWWQEFDTYRVGTTKQSESTMHTIVKREFSQEDFEQAKPQATLDRLNALRSAFLFTTNREMMEELFLTLKDELPEGFLQRRIVSTNYKTLQNIIRQRAHHRLPQWKQLVAHLKENLQHPELLPF